MNTEGVRMQKNMAMGGDMPSGDFGVEKMDHCDGGDHPDRHMSHKPMHDDERGAPGPVHHSKGHMPAQANPRHGPHHHRG